MLLNRDSRVDLPNGYCMQRWRPLDRVGICVPGGAVAYPSTVPTTAVPAQVARVRQLAVVAPPTRFGAFNPDLLANPARELGIGEVYRVYVFARLRARGPDGTLNDTVSSGRYVDQWVRQGGEWRIVIGSIFTAWTVRGEPERLGTRPPETGPCPTPAMPSSL